MDSRQIEFFASIVETGSFSSSAAELHISQSSLSKRIIALEKELDVRLFDRSKRKIELTEAGRTLHRHALNLMAIHRSLLADLKEHRRATPSLMIAAIPVTAQYGITAYVALFRRAYPQIHFTLEEHQASTVLPALGQHKYDLGFVRDYNLDRSVFATIPVAADRLLVAVSCDHRLASRKSISLTELGDENFIFFSKGTLIHDLSMNACKSAGFEPRVFYETPRAASIIDMVASNSGMALMMEKVLEFYQRHDVVAIPLEQTVESRVVIAYPKDREPSRSARIFLNFMQQQLVR